MSLPILCLDFDGVLHSYSSGWQGAAVIPDAPVPGAIAFLYAAICHFEVHIYSSRSHQDGGIDAMMDWLALHEAAWRDEEERAGQPLARTSLLLNIKWPTEKPAAFVTIDDRALTFTGQWPTIETLKAFQPWNKRAEQQPPTITDSQVKTAMAVLQAYVDGTLQTDLCDELDAAIEAAWTELLAHQPPDDYDEPSESPLTHSW